MGYGGDAPEADWCGEGLRLHSIGNVPNVSHKMPGLTEQRVTTTQIQPFPSDVTTQAS